MTLPSNYATSGQANEVLEGSVLKDFTVPDSINKEMQAKGYTSEELVQEYKQQHNLPSPHLGTVVYTTDKFIWGSLYRWNTPTRGSAQFDYVCPKSEKYCLKYGPYNPVGGAPDWGTAIFKKEK